MFKFFKYYFRDIFNLIIYQRVSLTSQQYHFVGSRDETGFQNDASNLASDWLVFCEFDDLIGLERCLAIIYLNLSNSVPKIQLNEKIGHRTEILDSEIWQN